MGVIKADIKRLKSEPESREQTIHGSPSISQQLLLVIRYSNVLSSNNQYMNPQAVSE